MSNAFRQEQLYVTTPLHTVLAKCCSFATIDGFLESTYSRDMNLGVKWLRITLIKG